MKSLSVGRGWCVLIILVLVLGGAMAQTEPAAVEHIINGVVKAGNTPLPGVNIVIGDISGRKVVTSTDADGAFSAIMPGDGRWVVRAELAAFSSATKEIVLDAAHPTGKADFQLILLSRVPSPQQQARQLIAAGAGGQGFQRLPVNEQIGADAAANGASDTPLPGMPSLGTTPDAATESVAVNGAMGSTNDFARNFDDLRERVQEMKDRGDLPPQAGQVLQAMGEGGPGGGPFMMGGPGGRGGRGGMRGFNINQPHGSLFYSLGNSALDASPYSLSGSQDKPDYSSSRFGGVIGGPLRIPKVFDGGMKTFFFLSVFGTQSTQPYDVFSRVPTDLEREGNFSQTFYTSGPNKGQLVQIINPATGLPFAGNIVPISSQAQALLKFIPQANQSGEQNFRYSTAQDNNGLNIGARLIHNFGAPQSGRRGGPGRRSRNNINFGFNYTSSNADLLRPFPTLGGATKSEGWSANVGDSITHGRWTNQLRFNFNQQNVNQQNHFAGTQNVAATAAIPGVSQNPLDWGVPGLSFSNYQALNDIAPLARRDRVIQLNDTAIWNRGKHTLRVGGDFRRMLTRLHNNTNPNGSFLFTGFATAQVDAQGKPVSGTGYDLADFLLGYAQQNSIQYSPYTYNFGANGYDLFVQDSWRMRSNLTLELGLRYEYVSPYSESDNRIVNLDVAPGFTAATPVYPDTVGPYTGFVPSSLVKPDRNNYAPRLGIAWKPTKKAVVRAGYGINYNLGQYRSIVQQLAFQPKFSFTETNTAASATQLAMGNGFPPADPNVVTNNYGVDPNYRLGYVQMWNLNVQYELTPTLVLNVGYTGSKGTALDMVRAPNRGPDGLLIPGVQAFLWETSQGDSILHSGSVRLRKRMAHGMSVGGTYTFAKSIDNASSIGGGSVVVAQNDLDLAAERGLSSFDVRHRLTGDYMYELPFGTGKKWLDKGGAVAKVLGDWNWSGTFTVQSGTPWTARVLGDFTDVSRGVNGTLRADYNGQPIQISDPTVLQWFNTAAFTVPAAGQFGNSGRNTIVGPSMIDFDMSLSKNIPIREMMGLEMRITATNVFNTPHFTGLDTVVNSPTFGQIISVGSMRKLQVMTRFRF